MSINQPTVTSWLTERTERASKKLAKYNFLTEEKALERREARLSDKQEQHSRRWRELLRDSRRKERTRAARRSKKLKQVLTEKKKVFETRK
jgi:hypothetical protein